MKIRSERDVKGLINSGEVRGLGILRAAAREDTAESLPAPSPAEDKLSLAIDVMKSILEKLSTPKGVDPSAILAIADTQEANVSVIGSVLEKLAKIAEDNMDSKPLKKRKWLFTPVRDSQDLIEYIKIEEL